MAKFKIIVSDPAAGTSKVVEVEEARAVPFIGKRIGETIEGTILDMPNQKLQVMGGSDKDGVPMRPNVHGGVRRRVVLSGGVGFKAKKSGERKRKAVRGNIITDDIVQINLMIAGQPKKPKEAKAVEAKPQAQAPNPPA
jgi:small subunit ribosomal protein S6e